MSHFILHKANTRGFTDLGWLKSHHTFSFGGYSNPERMHFGMLRVLNDDQVQQGMGFGTHPHQNMEIISIPLQGDLEHKDSMGNQTIIHNGDIQVMSAGSGISHSEYNKNTDTLVQFLQIWIIPNTKNATPRYGQISLDATHRKNRLQQILSPSPSDEGVWIHQEAWMHLGTLEQQTTVTYSLKKKGNGVYCFVINGALTLNKHALETRDGLGIWDTDTLTLTATTLCEILLIEVPME